MNPDIIFRKYMWGVIVVTSLVLTTCKTCKLTDYCDKEGEGDLQCDTYCPKNCSNYSFGDPGNEWRLCTRAHLCCCCTPPLSTLEIVLISIFGVGMILGVICSDCIKKCFWRHCCGCKPKVSSVLDNFGTEPSTTAPAVTGFPRTDEIEMLHYTCNPEFPRPEATFRPNTGNPYYPELVITIARPTPSAPPPAELPPGDELTDLPPTYAQAVAAKY